MFSQVILILYKFIFCACVEVLICALFVGAFQMTMYGHHQQSSYYSLMDKVPSPTGSDDSGVILSPRSQCSDNEDQVLMRSMNNYTTLESNNAPHMMESYEPISPYGSDMGVDNSYSPNSLHNSYNSLQLDSPSNNKITNQQSTVHHMGNLTNTKQNSSLNDRCFQPKKGNAKPRQTSTTKRPKKLISSKKASVNPRAKTVREQLEAIRKKGGNSGVYDAISVAGGIRKSSPVSQSLPLNKQIHHQQRQPIYPTPFTPQQNNYTKEIPSPSSSPYGQQQSAHKMTLTPGYNEPQQQMFQSMQQHNMQPQQRYQQSQQQQPPLWAAPNGGCNDIYSLFFEDDSDFANLDPAQLLVSQDMKSEPNQDAIGSDYICGDYLVNNTGLNEQAQSSFCLSTAFSCLVKPTIEGNSKDLIHYAKQQFTSLDLELALRELGEDGMTLMMYAVKYNNLDALRIYLDIDPSIITQNFDGYNLFHLAAASSQLQVMKYLLNFIGSDWQLKKLIDQPTKVGNLTPLHEACKSSNDEMVKLLVSAGTSIYLQEDHGYTALHLAVRSGNYSSVRLIVESAVEQNNSQYKKNENTSDGMTKNKINVINEKSYDNNTALHFAADLSKDAQRCSHQGLIIEYLLLNGADPCFRNNHNVMPIKLVPQNSNAFQLFARFIRAKSNEQQPQMKLLNNTNTSPVVCQQQVNTLPIYPSVPATSVVNCGSIFDVC